MTADCSRVMRGRLRGRGRSRHAAAAFGAFLCSCILQEHLHRQEHLSVRGDGPLGGNWRENSKSDKLLFTATLLLVCTSVVMVYSSSALIALEEHQRSVPVSCRSRRCGRCSACCSSRSSCASTTARYRQPVVIWTGLGFVGACARGRAVRPAGQRREPLARRRRARRAAVRAREDRRDLLHRGAARAADGPHRRSRPTRCCRSASSLGADRRR